MTQPSAAGERGHEPTAKRVQRRVAGGLFGFQRRDLGFGPAVDLFGEAAMVPVEERPVEEAAVRHQSPSKTGRSFLAKAS